MANWTNAEHGTAFDSVEIQESAINFLDCHLNSVEASCVNVYYTGEAQMYNNDNPTVADDSCGLCICADYDITDCHLGATFGLVLSMTSLSATFALFMF